MVLAGTPSFRQARRARGDDVQSSLPHVFIGGEHVGGLATGPGIATLDEDGELDAALVSALRDPERGDRRRRAGEIF